jgi:hypothetical protein
LAVAVTSTGCSERPAGDAGAAEHRTTAAPDRGTSTVPPPLVGSSTVPAGDPSLRAELVEMGREDQAERAGNPELPPGTKLGPPQDHARAVRLQEIVAERGWPTFDQVGRDGATAAWLVAQHADSDVAFQAQARDLLAAAVEVGQGDPTELAHLTDRVAVNSGMPQTYGTQVRCRAGTPAPATPLTSEADVDERRERVGLGTLAAYYDELGMMCANEEMDGRRTP